MELIQIKKIRNTFLILLLLIIFPFQVYALEIQSKNYVLYNLDNGELLMEQNKDTETSVASLTKIMTTLVAIEMIDDLNTQVVITSPMLAGLAEANAYVINLKVGQKVTYEDLLHGTLLPSGADATKAIVLSLANSEDKFVEKMNAKASELNLKHTVLKNTTGLEAEGQYSTVQDIASLLKIAMQNETFNRIFLASSYRFSDNSMTVYNSYSQVAKSLGIDVSYIKGAKTGFTDQAGRCLASIAYDEKKGIHYLLVTTQAPTSSVSSFHVVDAKTIYDYTFLEYDNHVAIKADQTLIELPTKNSKEKTIAIRANKIIKIFHDSKFDIEKVSIHYEGLDTLSSKQKVGDKVGTITIKYDNKEISVVDAILETEIHFSMIQFLLQNIILVGLITIAIVYVIVNLIRKKNTKKKKRYRLKVFKKLRKKKTSN